MRDSLVLYRTLLSDNFMWFTYIKIRPRVTSHELEIFLQLVVAVSGIKSSKLGSLLDH